MSEQLQATRDLLQSLQQILAEEGRLLEEPDVVRLQQIVERKDALVQQLANDAVLAEQASDAELSALVEACHALNIENGTRIEKRRRWVQERLGRLNGTDTYTARGRVDRSASGQWKVQA